MNHNCHVFEYYRALIDMFPPDSQEYVDAFKLLMFEFVDSVTPAQQAG